MRYPPRFFLPVEEIESQALSQIYNMSKLPVLSMPIAIMPDCHYGKGAVVGSVVPTEGAVLPAAVGVDLNCGMAAAKLSITGEDLKNLAEIRRKIEERVPVGFSSHEAFRLNDYRSRIDSLASAWKNLSVRKKISDRAEEKILKQLGTLGGGNHFIEISLDEENNVWIMLHSGSRNIGKTIAEETINRAKDLFAEEIKDLPDKDLVWLPEGTDIFREYTEALAWVADYASLNREIMFRNVFDVVFDEIRPKETKIVGRIVNCHHNYVQKETHFGRAMWITRKGAVSARKGEFGIIPGSMGAKSYIVEGKGNEESYSSCSHGAGRRMSRGAAKRTYDIKDLEEQTFGIECRKDEGVLDEIPGAYKDIDQVMRNQEQLVDIVATLKAVLCVKG